MGKKRSELSVTQARPTFDAFIENFFGEEAVNPKRIEIENLVGWIYYRIWDTWTRHGKTWKAKRDSYKEDFEAAQHAMEEAKENIDGPRAIEMARALFNAAKKYFDAEKKFSGDAMQEELEKEHDSIKSLVDSTKKSKGESPLPHPRRTDWLTGLQIC